MKNLLVVGVAAVIWAIWKTRNRASFEHILPNNPIESMCKIKGVLDYYSVMNNWALEIIGFVFGIYSRSGLEMIGFHR